MQINQGFAASGRGYVRAVFSRRMRGYALPLDLVRVHLRASNSAGMARRLRAAFAGYLVSSDEDEAGYPFRNSRQKYQARLDSLCLTARTSLDAPCVLPAGGCINCSPFWFGGDDSPQMVVVRGES